MLRLYDPISKTVYEQEEPRDPSTLQSLCRKVIIQTLTLKRIHQIHHLPLPSSIQLSIGTLSKKDFIIDVERISPEDHVHQCYPATCCLNNEDVILRVMPKFTEFTFPDLIGLFEEGDFFCCILLPSESLAEKIDKAKESGTTLDHRTIWHTLKCIIDTLNYCHITPISKISSHNIRYHKNGQISIDLPPDDETETVTVMEARMNAPVYEAPEVLSRQTPDDKAHSWNIGCLVYEMLALEPAFYDRSGMNPFSAYMDIMQGNIPQIPTTASESLTNLVKHCLFTNPADRYSLQDIKQVVLQYL
ncbi:serine/threonine-protein kinase Nek6-like [Saccostrea echinata]|uniref:serine/threonine-protein kinase Nek6-like n=1 Tax=Saccostrea echinata TaxID=191078 RepID=UPI002A83FEE0|nr:serine/threonine-protein kinase Nek6-like [Saccostrea echinata]